MAGRSDPQRRSSLRVFEDQLDKCLPAAMGTVGPSWDGEGATWLPKVPSCSLHNDAVTAPALLCPGL